MKVSEYITGIITVLFYHHHTPPFGRILSLEQLNKTYWLVCFSKERFDYCDYIDIGMLDLMFNLSMAYIG